MNPHFVRRRMRLTALQVHPKMEWHDKRLHCNGVRLNFSRKPLALKIVRAFMQDIRRPMSKSSLLQILNPDPHQKAAPSPRSRKSREQSLSRLLSRLRTEFKQKFQGVVPTEIYWFHFSQLKNSWLLYKLPGEGVDGEFYS